MWKSLSSWHDIISTGFTAIPAETTDQDDFNLIFTSMEYAVQNALY